MVAGNLALVYFERGEYARAAEASAIRLALDEQESRDAARGRAKVCGCLADSLLKLGREEEALEALTLQVHAARRSDRSDEICQALLHEAAVLARLGFAEKAEARRTEARQEPAYARVADGPAVRETGASAWARF